MTLVSKTNNPFSHIVQEIPGVGKYFSLPALKDPRVDTLPYTIRILLECAVRCCDEFEIKSKDVENILSWSESSKISTEIRFKPSRVLLQDFTGVPAAVDLAAMRDAMARLNGNPDLINPLVPVDLVIDHSVQVDVSRSPEALQKNQEIEFQRNRERFQFLKWAAKAFKNMLIVPPGSGIVHQVNLEYLARVVFLDDGYLYPDTVVGTDSHTTMIDALGVAGWGVGGIEAEAVMLGQPISLVLPEVIGFEFVGNLVPPTTATDLVLTVTRMLRAKGVVGKFVEYFGDGCQSLSLADRATIANMSPEYGATMGFFAVDDQTLTYLRQTGRSDETVSRIERYLKAQGLFRMYDGTDQTIRYSDVIRLNLADVVPCLSGPKRPHDHVPIREVAADFTKSLSGAVGFKGYGLKEEQRSLKSQFVFDGKDYEICHGSVVIAAITSCTNTSNPTVMLGSALLAKNAVEKGLGVMPYIKTSLSPGSGVVIKYFKASGLLPYLEALGFYLAGFGCQTCIGNSGELDQEVADAITSKDLVVAAVLSGNRNFEGRVHPLTRANYLGSPMLVVAYALAGTILIDFEKDPIGVGSDGNKVFLRDIWPSAKEIADVEASYVLPSMFKDVYATIATGGSTSWRELQIDDSKLCRWNPSSSYIHDPPFFQTMERIPVAINDIVDAYCLLLLGDSITTDHISPAGSIAKDSPAAKYLMERGITRQDFNSYGSRRGNDEIMARGTFANIRIVNKLVAGPGPKTIFFPTGEEMTVFDAAMKYQAIGRPLVILAGHEYGCGSSRDWAAKGPLLQGVRAVIAQSYERIHRSNLVGMGILPLQFIPGQSAETLGLTGKEKFTISLNEGKLAVGQHVTVRSETFEGHSLQFETLCRIDTEVELQYFQHGGILQYVLRKLLGSV